MKKIILTLFLITLQIVSANSNTKTILFLGDSLTEGLGVAQKDVFPNLVENMIKTKLKKRYQNYKRWCKWLNYK